MHAPERALELADQLRKPHPEGRAPADQDVIESGTCPVDGGHSHHLLEPTAHPIALRCVADLFCHRETEPRRLGVIARAGLQHKAAGRGLNARRNAQVIRALC